MTDLLNWNPPLWFDIAMGLFLLFCMFIGLCVMGLWIMDKLLLVWDRHAAKRSYRKHQKTFETLDSWDEAIDKIKNPPNPPTYSSRY